MTAAIAPVPSGTASCMAFARRRTSGTASLNASAPEATSAAYSPRLCPARQAGILPFFSCHKRQTAMPAVSITGWVLTVCASCSGVPALTICQRSSPKAAEASSKVARSTGESPYAAIMPTDCEP